MVWKTSTSKTIFQISNNNTSGRLVIVTCKNVQSQLYLHGIWILKLYYWVSHEHQTENSYFFWQLEDANIKTLKMYSLIFDALAYCEMITMVGLVNTSIISHNHHFFLSFFFFFLYWEIKINSLREFPGDPVVKTPHLHCRGYELDPWSLIWELRSRKHRGAAKKILSQHLSSI